MYLEITSTANNNIKHVKALHKKKYREAYNEFLVEGLRIMEYALDNNAEFNCVYYNNEITNSQRGNELLKRISSKNINLYKVNNKIFRHISTTDSPQGILGVVKRQHYDLKEIMKKDKFFLIILDRLQDPGNVGTIIRTSDAAGADGIIALKGTVDIYNSKTIRSTMGSIFTIPIINIDDVDELVKVLESNGADIIATTLKADKYNFEVQYGNKNAIIIGNEANGISDKLIRYSNIKVKIPIIGNAESLNASIASGIIIYELVRQSYFQKI
ncbi:TrmH family RNA methyltransferase [Paramaledivibacter caminithermalis]|uniref:RNA methyltransferase, TrmH family n=1 Tax=Paramaledivibacter caminithermalis (strain DSM 15212 / CIP 107654 / DViRD3) TaxID=1121301 RepID=A0A1M6PY98_PARC5|nr:RNA methyltransferase [Paramaledivibacter caminithermalis]SHK12867.1 RNA methyltransferase, TrmH family [Paramaledivibacter caminithermalis DSM 15212]